MKRSRYRLRERQSPAAGTVIPVFAAGPDPSGGFRASGFGLVRGSGRRPWPHPRRDPAARPSQNPHSQAAPPLWRQSIRRAGLGCQRESGGIPGMPGECGPPCPSAESGAVADHGGDHQRTQVLTGAGGDSLPRGWRGYPRLAGHGRLALLWSDRDRVSASSAAVKPAGAGT